MREHKQYLFFSFIFSYWFPVPLIFSRCQHIILLYTWIVSLSIYTIVSLFIHLLMNPYSVIPCLSQVKSVTINMDLVFLWYAFCRLRIFWVCTQEGYGWIVLKLFFLDLWEYSILVSIVTVSVYIPTTNRQGLLFPCIFVIVDCLPSWCVPSDWDEMEYQCSLVCFWCSVSCSTGWPWTCC